jgi:hypothetical protein
MKRERFHRMTTLLSKVFGPSVAALLLSMGGAPAEASACLKCDYDAQLGGGHWFCNTMWWFEPGGSTLCYIDQSGNCQIVDYGSFSCS